MTIESRQYDVLSVLTGIFALAYIGGAVYGLATGADTTTYMQTVGTPGLPLFGYWIRGKQ